MDANVGRDRALGTAVAALASVGLVFFTPYGVEPSDVTLPWLVGGVGVGVALVLAEQFTPTGRRVYEAFDQSFVARIVVSVVAAGLVIAAWSALGLNVERLVSVAVGAMFGQLLVPVLYLSQ